ncbi:hypothetical protein [Flavobacterium sp. I3-2]|uniref:hypothetical protein n=1 Tax=Flavobacterium sp. I3-2 TaxID=2748319 RepID=UPI0015B24AE3|nr:hypothetical protein [Flavobacterium sp. I3-2]
MKFIPFICLAFLISCSKKEEAKTVTAKPKIPETEMYTLETKNFFIDVPQGFAVNEMKIANKYAMKDFIKSDSLQYFLIASDNMDSKITIDFNSDFVSSDFSLMDLNQRLYQNYKDKFPNEVKEITLQKDSLIGNKQVNYLVFTSLNNDKSEQTMYVLIKENDKVVNLSFKTDAVSNTINQDKTNWKIIESIGLKEN